MANTITTRVVQDGPRNAVAITNMTSDGASGELSDEGIVAMGMMDPEPDRVTIEKIEWTCVGCTAFLEFDGLADRPLHYIEGSDECDWREFGGYKDWAAGGGQINCTTTGFTAAGDGITVVLYMKKEWD